MGRTCGTDWNRIGINFWLTGEIPPTLDDVVNDVNRVISRHHSGNSFHCH